jgi:anaerobic selenocysteine-containing dehydrogenase
LVLVGADPATDFPDRQLGADAVRGAGFVVAVDTFLNESTRQADVVLPAAGYAERPGTTTNIEGRVFRLGQKIVPPGVAWPDWMIASELAARLGGDLGVEAIEDLWAEITLFAPSHRGIDRVPRDGVVVGRGAPEDEAPAPMDPTQAPGVAAVESQGQPDMDTPVAEPADTADGEAGAEGEGEPAAPPVAAPPLITFTAPADAAPLPKLDGYSLRLVVTKELYDEGTLVQHAPSLANLARVHVVRANHYDLDRLGLGTGGQVRVTSPRATFTAHAVVDDGVPRGSVALVFGGQAGALIDVSQPVVDVRLENV